MVTPSSKEDQLYSINNQIEYHEEMFMHRMQAFKDAQRRDDVKSQDIILNEAATHAVVTAELRIRSHRLRHEITAEKQAQYHKVSTNDKRWIV